MEQVQEKKKTSFMKNVLMLMIAQFVVKLLGFIYKMVIVNIEGFGDIGNGYYNTGYQIYSLLLTISSVGLPSVIAKLVSERVAIGDHKGANRIFKVALKIFTTVGMILSLGLFFGADAIARYIINVPDVKYTLMVLAPAIVMVSSSSILRGYFAGLGNMKPTSVSQVLEQFFNCLLTICFVYAMIGKDTAIMAAAGNLSTTCAIVISISYLIIFYKRSKKEINIECNNQTVPMENKTVRQLVKTILAISIPMTIGSLISVVNAAIDTVTVSNCVQKVYQSIMQVGKAELEAEAMRVVGIISKVDTIIHLPLALNIAFSTALVPEISAAIAKNDMERAKKRLSFSFFATILIVAPCVVGLMVLATPILQLIYPTASEGGMILAISSLIILFVAVNYVINGGLYGIGKIYIPAIALLVGGIVKFILNIVLISNPNIYILGSPISSVVCQFVAVTICYVALKKHIKLEHDIKNHVIKPVFSACVMGVIVWLAYKLLLGYFGNSISTIVSVIIGAVIYVIMLILTKTLTKEDFYMIPYGTKIYKVLVKLGIYKEEVNN